MIYQQFTYSLNETFWKQYEIRNCIGEGSEGKVYLVWDKSIERLLALKVILFETKAKRQCYEKQVQMLKRFGGLYFPMLVNTFVEEETGYILMEYVEGECLKDTIEREGGLEPKEAMCIVDELGMALKQLHGAKEPVVFCDLKAENVIISKDRKVKIIDFGGAAFVGEKQKENRVGTYGYAPIEQWEPEKDVSMWWDIYALNKLFHYILTGNNPAMPPYTTPSILDFNITLPKTWDQVLLKFCDAKECRKVNVDEYINFLTSYKKKEVLYQLRMVIIKVVEYILLTMAVLIFYRAVWNHNLQEILKNRKILYTSLELFLILFIYRKFFINKIFSNRYHYRREKNVWKSAKKGICIFIAFFFLSGLNSRAEGEEESVLPVIFYNDARESVCIREDAVLKVEKNILIEIPIANYKDGVSYELEISCKSEGANESLKRMILFEKKP